MGPGPEAAVAHLARHVPFIGPDAIRGNPRTHGPNLVAAAGRLRGPRGMGSKYVPSIKDLKALRRFHEQSRRTKASGPVKNLIHLPVPKAARAPNGGAPKA